MSVFSGVIGNSSYTLQHALTLLPYKLLYAVQLAQHGLISESAQYCGAIQQAMGAVPKLPPGLSVCNTFTKDLLDRLQSYAAVSFSAHAHLPLLRLSFSCSSASSHAHLPLLLAAHLSCICLSWLLGPYVFSAAWHCAVLCTFLRSSHWLIFMTGLLSMWVQSGPCRKGLEGHFASVSVQEACRSCNIMCANVFLADSFATPQPH